MRLILLLAFSLLIFNSFSQLTDEQLKEFVSKASKRELVQRNSELLINREFHQSKIVAERLIELEPENPNFNYRMGFAMMHLTQNHNKAIPHLLVAVSKANKVYDAFSPNETKAPIDSYYYLGKCYHLNNEIDNARTYYNLFLSKSLASSELYDYTKLLLKQCDVAERELEIERNYEMINLGNTINTAYPEYAPAISLDGQTLFFTTRKLRADESNKDHRDPITNMYTEDIYFSTKNEDSTWTEPQLLDFCLPERNEATVSVSSDERRIYIYMDSKGNGDIFYSEFEDSQFKSIKSLGIKGVNTDAWEPHLSVSIDGNTIYFSSDRPGGYGGRDIYRIIRYSDGTWSEPQNLGPTINTQYDEDSPFISVDNKTLYFSSNGESSMGGFDVFVTVLQENGKWSNIINLGYPLNSTGDDIYFTTTADGRKGYLSSYRPDGFGEKDIYEIQNDYFNINNVALLTGKIITLNNVDLPEDVAFTLRCLNCGDPFDRVIRPKIIDKSNKFISSLEPCRTYEIVFHYNNAETEFYREQFDVGCEMVYQMVYREIILDVNSMTVIEKEPEPDPTVFAFAPLELIHYFGYNRNALSTSKGELSEFLTLVESQLSEGREQVVIYVDASASKVPTRSFKNNMELAESRANNIKQEIEKFLLKNDALKDKVIVKIDKISVGGPAYDGNPKNLGKYAPNQYIKLHIDGVSIDEMPEKKSFKSEDSELKGKL
jgi:tetratricopeptide (TPR) repeat protein